MLGAGHDAWVVGNEPAVVIDFQGMVDYAQPKCEPGVEPLRVYEPD